MHDDKPTRNVSIDASVEAMRDKLAATREQIKELKETEAEIVAGIRFSLDIKGGDDAVEEIVNGVNRNGETVLTVNTYIKSVLDQKTLKKAYPSIYAQLLRESPVTSVRVL